MPDERKFLVLRYSWRLVAGLIGLGALVATASNRARKLSKVSPKLRSAGLIAMPAVWPPLVPLMRHITRQSVSGTVVPAGMAMYERWIRSASGDPDLRIVILQRTNSSDVRPALLWLHGGGYVIGTPEIDFALLARILETTDVTIISVDYRLAPRDPFPAPLDDAMTALRWTIDQSEALGMDARRIAVGGNSAGGGLAAAVAQRARDEGISLTCQLLMYPMLDDRTACRSDHEGRGELIWTARSNRYGWSAYLGHPPGNDETMPYAAPARMERLAGLPPAWIGVGSLDLFYKEDVAYAERLREAGVFCELNIVADAPHAFDLLNFQTEIARQFHQSMTAVLVASFAQDQPRLLID